jgi:hypothetical protein
MLIYNKIEDIFHTCRRVYSHLFYLKLPETELNTIALIDFVYCFPQYSIQLGRKRKLSFLRQMPQSMVFNGSKPSHKYILEKSIHGAIRLLESKGIIVFKDFQFLTLKGYVDLPRVALIRPMEQLYDHIRIEGPQLLNDNLRLYENSYEKTA